MTTRKLALMGIASAAVLVATAAPFALAQTVQQRDPVKIQTAPAAQTERVSHPVNTGVLNPAAGNLVVAPLTEAECTGLGGKVITTATTGCASGKQCVTANDDNTTYHKCISTKG